MPGPSLKRKERVQITNCNGNYCIWLFFRTFLQGSSKKTNKQTFTRKREQTDKFVWPRVTFNERLRDSNLIFHALPGISITRAKGFSLFLSRANKTINDQNKTAFVPLRLLRLLWPCPARVSRSFPLRIWCAAFQPRNWLSQRSH